MRALNFLLFHFLLFLLFARFQLSRRSLAEQSILNVFISQYTCRRQSICTQPFVLSTSYEVLLKRLFATFWSSINL